MSRKYFIKSSLVLMVIVLLLASMGPAAAQEIPAQLPVKGQANDTYLIPLDYPPLDSLAIPAGLNQHTAAHYIEALARKNAARLLSKLEQMQGESLVRRYTILPELFAIQVTSMQPEAVNERLGSAGSLVSAANDASTCMTKAGALLNDAVLTQSRAAQNRADLAAGMHPDATATNPSIQVYTTPYGYAFINGYTNPNVTVTLKITRAGKLVVTRSSSSQDDGYYYFRPNFNDCPDNSYEWTARPGDTVEVSFPGGIASMVVVDLNAWANPFTDVVAGKTVPGTNVKAIIYAPSGSACGSTQYAKITTANGAGDFSINFTGSVNFTGRAGVDVYAFDANNNSTVIYTSAYHLGSYFGSGSLNGTIPPNTSFTAERERGGFIEDSEIGVSDARGDFGAYLGDVQPGDILRVTGGGLTLSLTAAGINAYLDPAANVLSGSLGAYGANRTVVSYFENSYRLTNTCFWDWYCSGAQANGSGNFTVNPATDILRGDDVYGDVFDSFGNFQSFDTLTAPYILAQASSTYIRGYWRRGTPDTLTITHKDGANNVKWSGPVSYQDDWDGNFYGYSNTNVIAGDKIEVTDGSVTEAMTVSNLSGRLNNLTGHLSGSAGNGRLVVDLWDLQPPYYYNYNCAEINIAGGSYNLDLNPIMNLDGWDEADLYNAGTDGHYTYLYRYTFSVSADKDSTGVWGYTETPGANTNISLWRGGSQIASANPVSSSTGYYGVGLSTTILEGDELRVQTGDGNSVSIIVPKLTVNIAPGNPAIYGKAPANQGVETAAYRRYSSGSTWGKWLDGPTNASGDYNINYAGMYWWTDFYEGCYQIGVGGPCVWGRVDYYRPDGHMLRVMMPQAAPAPADAFENDDGSANAKAITTRQTHSFHQNGDVDWVKFDVTAEQVAAGTKFEFMTGNLGFGMDTVITLYDLDGATYLAEDDDGGPGYASRLTYAFSTPGTYYLRIRPFDPTYNTAYCDAVYDVVVATKAVYVPMVLTQP